MACFENKLDVQIYMTMHRPFPFNPDCGWIHPVAAGSFVDEAIPLRDDTGDHIAHLNPHYCEMTTQYWVWKNRPSRYVGFYHYRRYLDFCPKPDTGPDLIGHLTSPKQFDYLQRMLPVADVIFSRREYFGESIRQQFERASTTGFWPDFLDAIRTVHPAYASRLAYFDVGSISTTRNIYVMSWGVFDDYMNDLFPVLDMMFRRCGLVGNANSDRYPGEVAERFLGLWLLVNRVRSFEVPFVQLPN